MQSVLKPYIRHFKDYHLPKPRELIPTCHPSFLPHSFLATMGNGVHYLSQMKLIHQDNYLQEFQDLGKRIDLNKCQGLVKFMGFHLQFQDKGVAMYLMYEKEKMTLKEAFNCYPTREESFWRVFFPLTRALSYLQKNKTPHGNLNYYSIVMTHDDNIKLLFNIGQPTSIDLYYLDSKDSDWEYLFLSPEELEAESAQDIENRFKSDVFNLGAILLTQLVETREGIYGDQNYMHRQLSSLKIKYSYELSNILSKMLELDYRRRPAFYELCLMLDELQGNVQRVAMTESRVYTDTARRMRRDLLSVVDLKETRRTGVEYSRAEAEVSQFS